MRRIVGHVGGQDSEPLAKWWGLAKEGGLDKQEAEWRSVQIAEWLNRAYEEGAEYSWGETVAVAATNNGFRDSVGDREQSLGK